MQVQLKLLWDLQELDLSISNLQQKLEEAPLISGVQETTDKLNELAIEITERELRLKEDRKTLKQLEMKTQKIVDDRKELSDNLYGGKITNVKELEQMQRKLDLLAAEKQKTEDSILVLMETVEDQEAALNEIDAEHTKNEQDLKEKEERLALDLKQFNEELSRMEDERKYLVEGIEKKYLTKYEILAKKHHGRPLASVVDDICGGCRVFISSAQRGHLYNPGTMVYCENCGRLLVKLDDQQ
jgi:uncharacterized protein